jgi:hypothetical protein
MIIPSGTIASRRRLRWTGLLLGQGLPGLGLG